LYKGNISNLTTTIYYTPHSPKTKGYKQRNDPSNFLLNFSTAFEDSLIYTLPKNQLGYYDIHLFNEAQNETKAEYNDLSLNFSIVVNSKDVTLIPYDADFHGTLAADQWGYYEMYIPHDGVISVELMECTGYFSIPTLYFI
jgi:hypothetical protein